MLRTVTSRGAVLLALLISSTAAAESKFGTVMKSHFRLRSVSCYACHVKDKEKTELTEFGVVLDKLLQGKRLSARLEEAKGADAEAKKQINDEVEKELIEAFKKLAEMKTAAGTTYESAIQAGEIEGLKPRS